MDDKKEENLAPNAGRNHYPLSAASLLFVASKALLYV
jgi:hypothetical protein